MDNLAVNGLPSSTRHACLGVGTSYKVVNLASSRCAAVRVKSTQVNPSAHVWYHTSE
jgi:hypothetical protein